MIELRRANERGHAEHGWLDSFHTFSFADYYDPKHMGFHALRVINEDRVQPAKGFGTHAHADMEIVSYVLLGAIEHRDSLGTGSVIEPGDVQRMSAGTGVTHSEHNASNTKPVHFLQIWILPERRGLPPGYEQKHFSDAEKRGKLRLVGSRDAALGSVTIRQDLRLYTGLFDGDERASLPLAKGRAAYVHVARGALTVNGNALLAGDAASLEGEASVELESGKSADVLVFDLA